MSKSELWSTNEYLLNTDIDPQALQRFIEEQIYTLPGTDQHREEFSILLTGSRAIGIHTPESDVDIDVVCPQDVYHSALQASFEAGIISSKTSFFCTLEGDDWHRYYGKHMGRPHFSLTSLDMVARDIRAYNDVPLWIWTNAKIITDPGNQFTRIIGKFNGYPQDVLIKKIKYHSLYSAHAGVDIYPHNHKSDAELLAAASAITSMVNELLRFFFLVDGKPFPYAEKLLQLAAETTLGKDFCPLLQRAIDLVVNNTPTASDPWQRLDKALGMLLCEDTSEEARALGETCRKAMIAAGVDPQWVEADYNNIDELLTGELEPIP